ncbi:MAG: InlB B-repeat-containing protein [Bacillus subtilis]|nr:InlB B-repeat-containing protein [Bacillus subtilis]
MSTLVTQPSITINPVWLLGDQRRCDGVFGRTFHRFPHRRRDVYHRRRNHASRLRRNNDDSQRRRGLDLPIPAKEGYLFQGWITGTGIFDVRYTSYMPFSRNTTLYALWQQDVAPIMAFLHAVDAFNFSGSKVLTATVVINGESISFRQGGMMKNHAMDGMTYRQSLDFEAALDPLGQWQIQRQREHYEVLNTIVPDELVESASLYDEDGWELSGGYRQLQLETGFELFEPALFEKRPGENKYDYPISNEQLIMYGIPVDEDVFLSKVGEMLFGLGYVSNYYFRRRRDVYGHAGFASGDRRSCPFAI